jgi:hypothetical protein
MVAANVPEGSFSEEQLAALTTAAYHVALRYGLRAPFIDVELDLWRELRKVLNAPAPAACGEGRTSGDDSGDAPEIIRCRR